MEKLSFYSPGFLQRHACSVQMYWLAYVCNDYLKSLVMFSIILMTYCFNVAYLNKLILFDHAIKDFALLLKFDLIHMHND